MIWPPSLQHQKHVRSTPRTISELQKVRKRRWFSVRILVHCCCDACNWSVDMFHENRQSGQMWILPETPLASGQAQPKEKHVEKPPQKYICQLDPLEGAEEPKMRDASIMVKREEAPFRSKVEEDAPAVDPNLVRG